jgi:CxxC-x17-CxxC domain-containing protein
MSPEANGEFNDIELKCEECGCDFVHTREKQEFYASKGLTNLPKRCPECREKRRAQNQKRQGGGGDKPRSFGGGNRPRGGGFNDRRGGGGFRNFDRPKFEVKCAECGKTTFVPFKPTGVRPVYCDECFRERRSSGR